MIRNYLMAIVGRLWLVILASTVLAAVTAVISIYVIEPVYESYTTLYVINRSSDPYKSLQYDSLMASQQLVRDYKEFVTNKSIMEDVIKDLNLKNITPEALGEKVSVYVKNDSRIFEIRVRDANPSLAKDLADCVSREFLVKVSEMMKVDNVNILGSAQLPSKPVAPKPFLNTVLAFVIGIILSSGICAGWTALKFKKKNVSEENELSKSID